MTATMSGQAQAAYRGAVYGIDLLDHASVMTGAPVVVLDDYVGKTRQRGRGRETQHRDDKPWSDLIVGDSHVLWEGVCTEDELDDVERRLIRERAPRMNKRDNLRNPNRIDYAEQVRQRHERDDVKGRPRWVPLEQRRRDSLLEWGDRPQERIVPVRRGGLPQWVTPFGIKVGLWSSAWVLLGVAVLGGFHHFDLQVPWSTKLTTAGVTATVLLGWSLWRPPDTWKLWRRRFRKARKAWFR